MNYKLSSIIIFAAGAAIGSAVTWKLVKTKYEQIAQEEIESVKEVYRIQNGGRRVTEGPSDESKEEFVAKSLQDKPDLMEYAASMVKDLGYSGESETKEEDEDKMADEVEPYVISPEDFDTLDDYDSETLTLYADGVLTDCYDNIIDDVDGYVGPNYADHFGEYEQDTVFIRNEEHLCDYEVQRDYRKWSEVFSS